MKTVGDYFHYVYGSDHTLQVLTDELLDIKLAAQGDRERMARAARTTIDRHKDIEFKGRPTLAFLLGDALTIFSKTTGQRWKPYWLKIKNDLLRNPTVLQYGRGQKDEQNQNSR